MPGKRHTRRSISLKGITYQRLKNHCEDEGFSISGYLETVIAEKLDAAGVPVPTKLEPRKPPPPPVADDIISQHFTF